MCIVITLWESIPNYKKKIGKIKNNMGLLVMECPEVAASEHYRSISPNGVRIVVRRISFANSCPISLGHVS